MKLNNTILKNTLITFTAVTALAVVGCNGKSGKPLVKIGNETITQSDLDTLARVNPRLKPRLATPAGREKVLDNYVEQELLYQESVRQGLDKTDDVKDKIALYQKIIVAQSLMDKELTKKVREYYDNHKDEFERVKISHIMIKLASSDTPDTKASKDIKSPKDKNAKKEAPKPVSKGHTEAEAEKLAKDIQDKLNKGEDFGALAKTYSEDEKTKDNQGDLSYVTIRDKRLERWGWLALAEKAFSLETGKVSDPIKTKDGIHLIKVTEAKSVIPFEEAETGLQFRLQSDLKTSLIEDLKKKYKVEFVKEAKPATPQAPANTPVSPSEPTPAAPAAPQAQPIPTNPAPTAEPAH